MGSVAGPLQYQGRDWLIKDGCKHVWVVGIGGFFHGYDIVQTQPAREQHFRLNCPNDLHDLVEAVDSHVREIHSWENLATSRVNDDQ